MTMPAWLDDWLFAYGNLVHALGVNGLLALSMYVVLAVGQLSLGQAAFMGLGAYSSALMTLSLGWPFWAVLPLSIVAPVLFALVIGVPTLRLSGVYLAIATIGLGEVTARPSTSMWTCSAVRSACPASPSRRTT